jgi:esterase/lipase
MKKFLQIILIAVVVLTVVYFLGPKPVHPKYDTTLPIFNIETKSADSLVAKQESNFVLKTENESRIVWADTSKKKTKYSILYLPGFTASQEEGDPIHTNIAKQFKCNLFLARLYGHGIKDTFATFKDFTVDKYWESAKNAYAIAKLLGDQVIIMSTSTGGTLSLRLAAEYNDIAAQVMLSPNIEINDPNAWLLNNPWGKQIASLVKGGNRFYSGRQDSLYRKYWYTSYHANGAVELQELIETSMTDNVFSKIDEPTCLLYYYKNEQEQDPVVKVSAMKKMFSKIATPAANKEQHAIPDAGHHVLGSYVESNDLKTVEEKIVAFMRKIVK